MWDGYSNCYTLTSKNSSKKLIGEWSNYLQITESNSDGNIVSAVQEQLLEMGERKYEGMINNIAANTNYAEGFVNAIMAFKSSIESDTKNPLIHLSLWLYPESANILFCTLSNYQLNKVLQNIDANKAKIACEGTAQWNWETCTVIFTITKICAKIGSQQTNVIVFKSKSKNDNIEIEKKYTEGDITESDVLVALFKNNKLVLEDGNTNKCIANKVNFNNAERYIHYYTYPSMYTIYDEESKAYVNYQFCLKCTLNVNQLSIDNYRYYSVSSSPCIHQPYIHNNIIPVIGTEISNSQNSILKAIETNENEEYTPILEQIKKLDDILINQDKTRVWSGDYNGNQIRKLCNSTEELINCWYDAE